MQRLLNIAPIQSAFARTAVLLAKPLSHEFQSCCFLNCCALAESLCAWTVAFGRALAGHAWAYAGIGCVGVFYQF